MGKVVCYWLEPLERVRVSLRRYRSSDKDICPLPRGYHSAMKHLVDVALVRSPEGYVACGEKQLEAAQVPLPQRSDAAWPWACSCGYCFTDEDHWQVFTEEILRRSDTGEETTIRDAPPGAMWNAWWMGEDYRGPDGKCLVVKTPGGEWMIDGPAKGGGRWTRKGTPPKITAAPSIGIGEPFRYHAYLRDGVLEEC